ncbi:MAG: hypothetical protein WBL88_16340 [Nitrososphaeraceae archaeon]
MQLTNYIPYGAAPATPADRVMRMHREFLSAIFFIINRLQQFELIPVIAKISFPQKGNFFIFNTNKMVSSPAAVSTTASSGLTITLLNFSDYIIQNSYFSLMIDYFYRKY